MLKKISVRNPERMRTDVTHGQVAGKVAVNVVHDADPSVATPPSPAETITDTPRADSCK